MSIHQRKEKGKAIIEEMRGSQTAAETHAAWRKISSGFDSYVVEMIGNLIPGVASSGSREGGLTVSCSDVTGQAWLSDGRDRLSALRATILSSAKVVATIFAYTGVDSAFAEINK